MVTMDHHPLDEDRHGGTTGPHRGQEHIVERGQPVLVGRAHRSRWPCMPSPVVMATPRRLRRAPRRPRPPPSRPRRPASGRWSARPRAPRMSARRQLGRGRLGPRPAPAGDRHAGAVAGEGRAAALPMPADTAERPGSPGHVPRGPLRARPRPGRSASAALSPEAASRPAVVGLAIGVAMDPLDDGHGARRLEAGDLLRHELADAAVDRSLHPVPAPPPPRPPGRTARMAGRRRARRPRRDAGAPPPRPPRRRPSRRPC